MEHFNLNQKVLVEANKLSPWYNDDLTIVEATISLISIKVDDQNHVSYRLTLDKKVAKKYPLALDFWYTPDTDPLYTELIADNIVEGSAMTNWISGKYLKDSNE